jgi:hypothetical protein
MELNRLKHIRFSWELTGIKSDRENLPLFQKLKTVGILKILILMSRKNLGFPLKEKQKPVRKILNSLGIRTSQWNSLILH